MSKEMVISANPHETRVAIMEEGQLCEYYVERQKEFALVGSIYKGRVTRVLPGMQSAFVDIGLDSDAFLYVTDFLEGIEELDEHVETAGEKIPTGDGPGRTAELRRLKQQTLPPKFTLMMRALALPRAVRTSPQSSMHLRRLCPQLIRRLRSIQRSQIGRATRIATGRAATLANAEGAGDVLAAAGAAVDAAAVVVVAMDASCRSQNTRHPELMTIARARPVMPLKGMFQ